MPGKPFYSMEEVCERLGKSADDVKALVRDGVLREFRDAGKIFFKADDVEKLLPQSNASEDTGDLALESAEDSGSRPAPDEDLTQVTDTSGGTSIIGLEPLEDEETAETEPEETDEDKEDTVITASGIGVFDDDELEIDADPMAKTQITGATDDQVSLEGAGSGSGLLDLAREADDTALGADLLDEIYPGEETASTAETEEATEEAEPEPAAAAVEEAEPEAEVEEAEEEEVYEDADVGEAVMPVVTRVVDSSEGMFSGLLVGALVLLALACSVVAGVVQGFVPDYGLFLGDGSMFYIFLGGSALLVVIGLLVGWFLGRALVPRRR